MSLRDIERHSRDVSDSMYSLVDEVDSMREEVVEALADEKRKSDELHQENLKAAKTDLYKQGWNAAMEAVSKAMQLHTLPDPEGDKHDGTSK